MELCVYYIVVYSLLWLILKKVVALFLTVIVAHQTLPWLQLTTFINIVADLINLMVMVRVSFPSNIQFYIRQNKISHLLERYNSHNK